MNFLAPIKPTIPIASLLNINPGGHEDPVVNAEKNIEITLDELVSTGALQTGNRMNIEALLNPADEQTLMHGKTDEEICKVVLDAEKGQLIGGNDEADDADDYPTHHKLLQAATVINKYTVMTVPCFTPKGPSLISCSLPPLSAASAHTPWPS
jgi:hypothetical protein